MKANHKAAFWPLTAYALGENYRAAYRNTRYAFSSVTIKHSVQPSLRTKKMQLMGNRPFRPFYEPGAFLMDQGFPKRSPSVHQKSNRH